MRKILWLFCIPLLTSCYLSLIPYALEQGFKQGALLLRAEPLEELIQDPKTPPVLKKKFQLTLKVVQFAKNELGMKIGKHYQKFIDLKRGWIVQIVTAAKKDSLTPYLFEYPMLGKLPYKGFFDEADAIQLENQLKSEGWDTYRRRVPAFSSVGFLPDPLLNSMIQNEMDLVITLLHELTHTTIYLPSSADYNEALASWIGFEGAKLFLQRHPEAFINPAKALEDIKVEEMRIQALSDWVPNTLKKVNLIYSDSSKNLEMRRQDVFELVSLSIKENALLNRVMSSNVNDWNNARLLGLSTYYTLVPRIDALSKKQNLGPLELLKRAKELEKEIVNF